MRSYRYYRSVISAVVGTALFVLAPALPAFAEDETFCDPYPDVRINVTPVFDEPVVDTSVGLLSLQNVERDPQKVIPHYDNVTLGLTRYEPVIEFRSPMETRAMYDGTTCARIRQIDATIGYRNVTVFLAHELTDNACALQHVLEHEKKHVAVNRSLLQHYVPEIKAKLVRYFKLYGLYRGPNAEYAETLMREKANFVLSETARQISLENRQRQRAVDTPFEYARNSSVCGGKINEIVRRATNGR